MVEDASRVSIATGRSFQLPADPSSVERRRGVAPSGVLPARRSASLRDAFGNPRRGTIRSSRSAEMRVLSIVAGLSGQLAQCLHR